MKELDEKIDIDAALTDVKDTALANTLALTKMQNT